MVLSDTDNNLEMSDILNPFSRTLFRTGFGISNFGGPHSEFILLGADVPYFTHSVNS